MASRGRIDGLRCPDCRHALDLVSPEEYRCESCGRIFPIVEDVAIVLPRYLEETKLHEDELWRTSPVDQMPPWWVLVQKSKEIQHFSQRFLPKQRFAGRVLDVGAGACWSSALIKLRYPAAIVYATDISPTSLQRGRQVADLLGSPVDYFVALDAEAIPFPDHFFDQIFASSALHHLPHPERAFFEMSRCLKQSGELVAINEGASSIPFTLLGKTIGVLSEGRGKGVTENRYTLRQWRDLLIRGGFTNIIVRVEREEMRAQGGWKALLGTLPTRLLQLLRPDITIYART